VRERFCLLWSVRGSWTWLQHLGRRQAHLPQFEGSNQPPPPAATSTGTLLLGTLVWKKRFSLPHNLLSCCRVAASSLSNTSKKFTAPECDFPSLGFFNICLQNVSDLSSRYTWFHNFLSYEAYLTLHISAVLHSALDRWWPNGPLLCRSGILLWQWKKMMPLDYVQSPWRNWLASHST
jgi:hypothetical protein